MSYEFYVDKAEKVDLVRICRECVEDHPDATAILVVSGKNALLLLKQAFLDKFNYADDQKVAGEYLQSVWGKKTHGTYQHEPTSIYFANSDAELPGFRGKTLATDRIESVLQELKAARAYQRRIKVKVSVV